MVFALLWLVIGWFNVMGMSIANSAHLTGLLVGLAMALVDSSQTRKRA
jgi:GlpG protein